LLCFSFGDFLSVFAMFIVATVTQSPVVVGGAVVVLLLPVVPYVSPEFSWLHSGHPLLRLHSSSSLVSKNEMIANIRNATKEHSTCQWSKWPLGGWWCRLGGWLFSCLKRWHHVGIDKRQEFYFRFMSDRAFH